MANRMAKKEIGVFGMIELMKKDLAKATSTAYTTAPKLMLTVDDKRVEYEWVGTRIERWECGVGYTKTNGQFRIKRFDVQYLFGKYMAFAITTRLGVAAEMVRIQD